MSDYNTKIEESLGIEPYDLIQASEKTRELVEADIVKNTNEELDEDFVHARKNILKLIEDTETYLEDAMRIARSTEDPKAFMAANNFLKTLVDLNNKLVSLYEQRNKSKEKEKESNSGDSEKQVTNNTLFVGSGKDLNKFIEDLKNGNAKTHDITKTTDE